jgi:hypothetical protein
MKAIPKASYESVHQIEARILLRQAEADALPPGNARQSILIEVAQLRAYADVKRWLSEPLKEKKCRT